MVLTGRIELRVSRSTTERPAIERNQERLNGRLSRSRRRSARARADRSSRLPRDDAEIEAKHPRAFGHPIRHNRVRRARHPARSVVGGRCTRSQRLDDEQVEQLVIGGHARFRTAGNGRGYGGRTRHSSLMRAGPFPTEAPRGIGKRGRTRTCGDRNQNPAPWPAWRRAPEFGPANGSSTREVQR